MSEDTYLHALRQAQIDLAQAIEAHDKLSFRIVRLQQLVKSLSEQSGPIKGEIAVNVGDRMGFTDAVLTILRNSEIELTARNIRDRMVEHGYELGKYANPLGFVHSVLNRLMAQGKIRQAAPGCFVPVGPTPNDMYWAAFDAMAKVSTVVPCLPEEKPTSHGERLKAIDAFPGTAKRRKK